MNTQTHILISTALFAKPGKEHRLRNWAAVLGGLVPDVLIFVMFGWSKIIGAPEMDVWRTWYFTAPWQTVIDASNSIPIFLAVLLIGLYLSRVLNRWLTLSGFLIVLALSAFAHIAGDIPLHVDDGHAHFWPLSDWRYVAPFSYWDPNGGGIWISIAEAALGLVLIAILWQRFTVKWVRGLLVFSALAYTLPVIYFGFIAAHH